ncbi:glycosyltransferase family protein 64 C3 [Vicia villosa]|uniref:glycosyltransferase family protein 64 C3 n=1 Tax=Vicia villosa TaxID=3911 RepID=UPI00273BA3A3|nr:glycosyltransferase family protein 64 C3 [Vicia villosa]
MTSPTTTTLILAVLLFLFTPTSTSSNSNHHCGPTKNRDPQNLQPNKITVLINGFSETRIPILQSLAATYSLSPLVSSVLVLWGNPSTPPRVINQLALNLSLSSDSISLHRNPSSSLNDRFLPRLNDITTDAVLVCDDDVEVDEPSFEFAFRVWLTNRERIVGVFARSHDVDMNRKEWVYTVHPDRFSIVLTKFMLLKSEYLFRYSCEGGPRMVRMRKIVDSVRNCEDILMNFVVADATNVGPILVGVKRVRDYGDARNDEGRFSLGLSGRKGVHRKNRGWCISEFHRAMGRMPLRYSYGKVVDSIGEQGLCRKGGKLVFCDQ